MAIKLILNNQAQSLTDLNPTPTASESSPLKPNAAGFKVSLGDRVAGSTLTSLFYEYGRHTHGIVITFVAISFRWSFEEAVHLYEQLASFALAQLWVNGHYC